MTGALVLAALLSSVVARAAQPTTADAEALIKRANALRGAKRDQEALPLWSNSCEDICEGKSGGNLVSNADFAPMGGNVTWPPFMNGDPNLDASGCPTSGSMDLAIDGARSPCMSVTQGSYFFGFMALGSSAICVIRWYDNCTNMGYLETSASVTAPMTSAWTFVTAPTVAVPQDAAGAQISCSNNFQGAHVDKIYFSKTAARF